MRAAAWEDANPGRDTALPDMTWSGDRKAFQVAEPGSGRGSTDIEDQLTILDDFKPSIALPGWHCLMVSTTGELWACHELIDALQPVHAEFPEALRTSVERIAENCEPSNFVARPY